MFISIYFPYIFLVSTSLMFWTQCPENERPGDDVTLADIV